MSLNLFVPRRSSEPP